MKASTPAQRQQARRDRLKAGGFRQMTLWVHISEEHRVKDLDADLRKPTDVHSEHNQQPD